MTNQDVSVYDFNGLRTIVRNVLAAFNEKETCRWFASLGVELKREETGKFFPVSNKARTILDALIERCRTLGIQILTDHRVDAILPPNQRNVDSERADGFLLHHEHGEIQARRVIMATGGRSLPRTGSDGLGWKIVERLGHTVTSTYPALVPLVLSSSMFHGDLSGLSHEVELTTMVNGKVRDRRTGSLLWTHFGISGPVVMDCSRFWTIAATGSTVEVRCNVWPGMGFQKVNEWIVRQSTARPKLSLAKVLAQQIPERLACSLCRGCGIDPVTPAGQLRHELRRKLVHVITALPLPIERDRGWNYAEVTAGGVPLNEINFRTMESRKISGLHVIGEMLDCDGRIGGFNFQWAWATGYIGGRGAAMGLATVR